MKLLVFLLLIFSTCCSNSGVLAFDELELDYNDNFQYIPEYQSQARFLNVSFDDIFNNSLLTLGGIFVIGVILFGKALTYLKYYNPDYVPNHFLLWRQISLKTQMQVLHLADVYYQVVYHFLEGKALLCRR